LRFVILLLFVLMCLVKKQKNRAKDLPSRGFLFGIYRSFQTTKGDARRVPSRIIIIAAAAIPLFLTRIMFSEKFLLML